MGRNYRDESDYHLRQKKTVGLNEEVQDFLTAKLGEKQRAGLDLRCAWESIATPAALEHTDNVVFGKRKAASILIYVDSSAWAAELSMQSEFYRQMMERQLDQPVSELTFLVSRITALRKEFKKSF